MAKPLEVPIISRDFAEAFTCSKRQFVKAVDDGCTIRQTGGAYLESPEPMPPWPALPPVDEAVIETFVSDLAGGVTATGSNEMFIEAWLPLVHAISEHVSTAIAAYRSQIAGPTFVTASLTPVDQLAGLPHVDDNQYIADEGVGLVAIYGEMAGPRVAHGVISHAVLRSPTQLQIDDDQLGTFARGESTFQQADADRIIVFPQFVQLHAGPVMPNPAPGLMRNLLVLRAKTIPV